MKTKIIAFLIFVIHIFLSEAACPSGHNVYYGKDIDGAHNLADKAGKLEDCCRLCAETPGCVAYAYGKKFGDRCWLKKSATAIVDSPNPDNVLGIMNEGKCSQGAHTIKYGFDIGGEGGLTSVGGNLNECCKKCAENPACVAFSWGKKYGNTCWLKKSTGPVITSPNPDNILYVKQGGGTGGGGGGRTFCCNQNQAPRIIVLPEMAFRNAYRKTRTGCKSSFFTF